MRRRPAPSDPEPTEAEVSPGELTRREFDATLQRLLREYEGAADNPGSVRCEGCRACVSCMFCTDCEECHRCTHCSGCRSCSHLTHCDACQGCHDCAYCEQCENCARSSYLVLSRGCSDCTYCFGCVGLAKKDFHILNRPYTRSEYFRILDHLRAELGLGGAPLMAPLVAALAALAVAAPGAEVTPSRVRPGDAILLTIVGAAAEPEGALAGRPLRFWEAGGGTWRALAALPLEAPTGPADLDLRVMGEPVAATLEVLPGDFRSSTLSIPPRFLDPPPAARKRMVADRAALNEAYARPFAPPRFTTPFQRPSDAEPSGRFGDQRVYNGKTEGVHYGLDLAAKAGSPVVASNDGVVVLARDCYQSGQTILLFHGAGLFTAYFHMSRMDVKAGETVRQGQGIGRVGSTGRSTGPHLHWGVKLDGLWVDPVSLERLGDAPVAALIPSPDLIPDPPTAPASNSTSTPTPNPVQAPTPIP